MFTPIPEAHWQVPGEEIDIAAWPESDEYPIFPEGSRDKRLLHCPSPLPQPWLVPGHRYLFKKSRDIYPEQYWVEIVASRLSRLTGVPVPPAYASIDSRTGECAALIEWFWGYPNSLPQGFLSGGLFMQALVADFDHKKGTQHNFEHVYALCQALARKNNADNMPLLQAGWLEDWVRMLTFDALLGNTDRHQENWGLVYSGRPKDESITCTLSPAFDNGTSLGHEILPEQFARRSQGQGLRRYIERGHHHIKWQLNDVKRCNHLELLQKILLQHPVTRPAMLSVLEFSASDLHQAIMPLCGISVLEPLTPERARFMESLLLARRDHLHHALQR